MRSILVAISAIFALAGCAVSHSGTTRPAHPDVVVYSGPNMRTSLEEMAATYEKRTGVHVTIVADDVRPLIERIKRERETEHRVPDLFVTHDPFLAVLIRDGIAAREAWSVASLVPVIVVPRGNPQRITGLRDLARPGLRVGLTNAEQTISGEIMKVMFRRAGIDDAVRANVTVRTSQGRDLCKALIAGKCDVGIVWNAVIVGNADQVESIDIDTAYRPKRGEDAEVDSPTLGRLELDYVRVAVAILEESKQPEEARRFAQFVRTPEATAVFVKNGFSPAAPDRPPLMSK